MLARDRKFDIGPLSLDCLQYFLRYFWMPARNSDISSPHMTILYLKIMRLGADFGPSCWKDVRHEIIGKSGCYRGAGNISAIPFLQVFLMSANGPIIISPFYDNFASTKCRISGQIFGSTAEKCQTVNYFLKGLYAF